MTTHRITLLAGWYQVDETRADGTVAPIGSFRTEADARDWLTTYLRMQAGRLEGESMRPEARQIGHTQDGTEVFKVGYSAVRATVPTKTDAAVPAPAEASVNTPESN